MLALNVIRGDWDEAISVYGQCNPYIHDKEHLLMKSFFGCLAFAFAGDPIEKEDMEPLHDEAIQFEWASVIMPGLCSIGRLFQTEQNQTRKERAEEIIVLFISHIDPWLAKGWMFLTLLGNMEEALKAYEKEIELNNTSVAWNNKGAIYERLQRYEEALDAYEKVLEIEPDNVQWWINKADLLDELGRYSEMVAFLDEALRKHPEFASLWVDKSYALIQLGEHKKALEACEKALEIEPGHAFAWNNKGVIFKNLNELQEALNCYEKAVELDPDYALAKRNRDEILNKL